MTIQVTCSCGKKLSVKDELAGRRVKCPACQQALSIPKLESESPDDEWDLAEGFDDEARVSSKTKKQASQRSARNKKSQAGQNRGMVMGLLAGGGLLAVALLTWNFWPAKQADIAVTPNNHGNNASPSSGEMAGSTSMPDVSTGTPLVNVPKIEGDLGRLQGNWHVTDVQVDPEQPEAMKLVEVIKQFSWTIKDDILTMARPDFTSTSTMKLDTAQSPKTIDLIPLDGNGTKKTGLAIYTLDGDDWKLCLSNSGESRPKEMKPYKSIVVLTLKKGSPPENGNATPVAQAMQFDLKAWQEASGKLKEMKVFALLNARQPGDSSFPDGLSHFAVIDPQIIADGRIPPALWELMLKVSFLAVRTTTISDATLEQLSNHPGLIGLNISGQSTVTATGITHLKKCPHLRSLYFSGIPVTQELVHAMTQIGGLRQFGISDVPVSSEMLGAIVRLENLTSLSLQKTGLSDDDAAQIARLTKLQSLLLNNSKITDKGLQPLKNLTELTTLDVRGLTLSPQALAEFSTALPKCRVFK